MHYYRITKYNPKYRNNRGFYEEEEWTSFSGIGRSFNNETLSIECYLHIESLYINFIMSIMRELSVDKLRLVGLEMYEYNNNFAKFDSNLKEVYDTVEENLEIPLSLVDTISRLILRDMIWGKLESSKLFVHFGYDYYMYIGSVNPIKCREVIEESGLFIEDFESPYLDLEEE